MVDKEKDRIENFKKGHYCPGMKLHDYEAKKSQRFQIMYSSDSGIGPNTYILCHKCGTQQDVTDYEVW